MKMWCALNKEYRILQSPDCPLCISLLELHSDRKQCAEFILDCASSVSLQLMPNDSGQLNEEIDKQFVIGYVLYVLCMCASGDQWNAGIKNKLEIRQFISGNV